MAEVKKATAKVVAKVPAEEKKVEVKAAEVKAPEVKAEIKKEAVKKTPAAKKAPAKKAPAAKKETVKKETVKKAPAAKKPVVKEEVNFQFSGKSYTSEDLIRITRDVWKYDLNGKEEDIQSIELYVKPEENTAYYVINGDVTGSFFI
jgi:glucan-binding YG repeat protein